MRILASVLFFLLLSGITAKGQAASIPHTQGCSSEDIVVPASFAPNGERQKNELHLSSTTIHKIIQFEIFNRWGQPVFQTKDMSKGWDGTQNNKAAPEGVYFYHIKFLCPTDNVTIIKKGNLTLLR